MKKAILPLFMIYACIVPGYRAKLAPDTYGERDMTLWEAHKVSGAVLKANLSFLPVIGKFFEN